MATKDYYPANTEWEVLEVKEERLDFNFRVKVIPTVKGKHIATTTREVRTPYRPRTGQLIKLSRQDA